MRSPDPRLPEVFTRAEALAAGVSESQVKTRVRNGNWKLLRRGVFCQSAVWEARDRRGRHLLSARAVLSRVGDGVWLSHASGAAAHDLPTPLEDGPAIADGAFRSEPHLMAEVELILEQCTEWPYAARGTRVLAVADGRRESPLESWSYWYLHQYSVPMPEPQVDIYDQFGLWLGRVDAWWPQFGVIGEADGRVK